MEYPPQDDLEGGETLSPNRISLGASRDDDSLHSHRSESKLSTAEHAGPEDSHGSRNSSEPANEASDRPELGVEDGEQGDEHVHGWSLFALLLGICLAVFIISVDRTIITTAIPFITKEFKSTTDIGWYGSAYLITACAFQPIYGRVYLLFSEKWSYLIAIGIFEIGSLICGLAPSSIALIVGRAIAGLGSAGVLTGSFIMVISAVPLQKRPVYTATVGVMFGVGATVGPLFGGIFTDLVTWRWCFYINLPVGGVTVLALLLFFKSKEKPQNTSFKNRVKDLDLVGNIVLLGAVIMLLLALQLTNTGEPWASPRIIGLLCGFGTTAIAFAIWLWWRGDSALIPPAIICQRTVAASCIMAVMVYGALLVQAYFLPIWFQGVLGTSALQSGVNMIPYFVVNAFFSVVAGVFVSVVGYYVPPCLVGNTIATVGCGLLTTLSRETTTAQWAGYQVLVAAGFGLSIQQGFTAVQTVLPAGQIAIGTAAVVACQSLGGAIFVSAGNTIFQGHLQSAAASNKIPGVDVEVVISAGATAFRHIVAPASLPALLREYNEALRLVFLMAVPLAGISLVSNLFLEWRSVKHKNSS